MGIIDLTDGWLTDWGETGGRFKEWVRCIELNSINHGYIHTLLCEPGNFWRQFLHVVSWLPALWDDRDWDHAFLYIMIREKLSRMRTSEIEFGGKEHADQMKEAVGCLDRLIRDDYVAKDWAAHEKKYGSPLGAKRDGIRAGVSASVRRIGKKEDELIKRDLETFVRIFADHSREWWT